MARFQTAPTKLGGSPVKRGKKPKKRKRGAASRARLRENLAWERANEIYRQERERRLHRLKELEEETRECYESVLEPYTLSNADRNELGREWKLGLNIIADYEDATPEELLDLDIFSYDSEPISELAEEMEYSEASLRASFDLSNALGLSMIKIDEAGNVNGEKIGY